MNLSKSNKKSPKNATKFEGSTYFKKFLQGENLNESSVLNVSVSRRNSFSSLLTCGNLANISNKNLQKFTETN